jgi:hypothetical protein
MSYHTAYPNWDSQAVVCHLFLYSFICAPILGTLLVQGFIFERGSTIFKIFKEHNLYRFVQFKVR